ncbi:hypothetical protein SDC9_84610 [bioreactor metagenome]|uniref:Uncharacterized protein n=1 Tax=bioreactor metagenome TaxID=1076179 RepID=A0A644ZBC5_9ZZZZ
MWCLLNRTGREATNEVALHDQEDRDRYDHGDERSRAQQVPGRTAAARQLRDVHGQRRHPGAATQEDHRDQQVIPRPEELEDAVGNDCRSSQRQHDTQEDLHRARTVDRRGFHQRRRQIADRVEHHEDGQGQPEDRVRDPDCPVGAVNAERAVHLHQRHQRHLQRNDLKREDRDEQPVASGELQPREAIGSQGGQCQWKQRARDRDDEGVHEIVEHGRRAAARQRPDVVVQREIRIGDDRPPTRPGDVGLRPE